MVHPEQDWNIEWISATIVERKKRASLLEGNEPPRAESSTAPELGLQRWNGNLHGHQSPPRAIGM